MQELTNYYVSGQNEFLNLNAIPGAASYVTRNNIQHQFKFIDAYTTSQLYTNLISYTSTYKPTIVIVCDYDANSSNNAAHCMVLLGYIKHPTNINNSKFFIYDVWDGDYKWETYSDMLNGTMRIDGRALFGIVYSL